jgi:hypothetical protein
MKPKPLIRKARPLTFNHGVEGSSPSALTNEINYLIRSPVSSKIPRVCKRVAARVAAALEGRRARPSHHPLCSGYRGFAGVGAAAAEMHRNRFDANWRGLPALGLALQTRIADKRGMGLG